jgi:uncharacterized membrane protein YphA (DoxX/SURF4 family)
MIPKIFAWPKLFAWIEGLPIVKNSPPSPLLWMSLMRIMLGLMFLTTWGSNASQGFYTPDGLEDFLRDHLNEDSLSFYRTFLEELIIPAKGVFAPFQLVAEGLLGGALLLGLFTRPAAVAGLFFILNVFLLSIGNGEWPWSYLLVVGLLGGVFFANAGRYLGLDAYLHRGWGDSKLGLW